MLALAIWNRCQILIFGLITFSTTFNFGYYLRFPTFHPTVKGLETKFSRPLASLSILCNLSFHKIQESKKCWYFPTDMMKINNPCWIGVLQHIFLAALDLLVSELMNIFSPHLVQQLYPNFEIPGINVFFVSWAPAMGIGSGIRRCRCKCRPMLVLRWQKNAVVKVFTYAVFLCRFYSVADNSWKISFSLQLA